MCELVESICGYERIPLILDPEMVDLVTLLYFTQLAATGSRATDGVVKHPRHGEVHVA